MLRHVKAVLDVAMPLVVIAAAGVVLWRTYNPPSAPGARPRIEEVTGLTLSPDLVRHVRGNGNVALVAFSDYECPFCAKHVRETGPMIMSKLLNSGDVREVYLNFPLAMHANAYKAGEAAECAGQQGRFWEMHEALFAEPRTLEIADFMRHAVQLRLNLGRFTECIESGETAAAVERDRGEGKRLAVNATPTFFIGLVQADGAIELRKRIDGAVEFEEFERAIRELRSARAGNARTERSAASF